MLFKPTLNVKSSPRRQQGVVLIVALFIVALVTTIVVSVSWRFNLSMARNQNRWHGSQANLYLQGAEQFARQVLTADAFDTPNVDSKNDLWYQLAGQAMSTDEGTISGVIEDAHSRINLNLLVKDPQQNLDKDGKPKPPNENDPQMGYNESQWRFMRLLQMLELESGQLDFSQARELMDALNDWLDEDNQVSGFGGAEKSFYESLDPPYPISNGPMKTVSELSRVKGFTPEIYQALLPYVIALPADIAGERFTMNINTMPDVLLRTLNGKGIPEPLAEADLQAIKFEMGYEEPIEGQPPPEDPYVEVNDIGEFVNRINAMFPGEDAFDGSDLGTVSQYFLLQGEAIMGDGVEGTQMVIRDSKVLLFRDNKNPNKQDPRFVRVIRRTDANF